MLSLTVFGDMAPIVLPYAEDREMEIGGDFAQYTMSSSIHFATPQSRGDFMVHSPSSNRFYISVSIVDPATQKSIMYTGAIPPGETRDNIKLDIPLENGVYECIAEITAYDLDDIGRLLGRETRDITLYVGEK